MKYLLLLTLILFLLNACAGTGDSSEFLTQPGIVGTTMPGSPTFIITITPSPTPTPSPISLPTNTYTASPEPAIAPNCNITNDAGQIYVLSDLEFHSIFTTAGKLERTLTVHYPEWASYRQMVSWSTQPETLGEIINSASLDPYLNLQINSGVILVTVGESLGWQLPSNTDFSLKATEISEALNRPDLDWHFQQNESLRSQYPQVANGGTYALYKFFNGNPDSLRGWCNTYQRLFGTSP